MFNIIKKSINFGGRKLEIETGKIARQADGAVVVTYGNTKILATAVYAKEPKLGLDFFPLTVAYQEKFFASGRIPGGFFKREGRPTQRETLISRLIDRPIRPLFKKGFKNETQVICTVLSHDKKNETDVPAIIAASAALAISGAPFAEIIAATKVAEIDGEFQINPQAGFCEKSTLELVIAGTKSSVMMVESEVSELSEERMLEAVEFAHQEMQPVIDLISELKLEVNKPEYEISIEDDSAIEGKIAELGEAKITNCYAIVEKQQRSDALATARAEIVESVQSELPNIYPEATEEELEGKSARVASLIKNLEKKVVRSQLLKQKTRIDGRKPEDVRQIECEVGLLANAHGSALFTRGETQALVVTTLGSETDSQMHDNIEGETYEKFMLHYNFPPFSVGETSPLRPPGRREIGHGKLAWRAMNALVPSQEEFPYTIRLVSEITESNGSSSMATVCGGSLALMDAGVPIKKPVAGIAMGLVLEGEDYVVLSDIMGDEDHLGDMDFKVAGTSDGITSLQMDIKVQGITIAIMKQALAQAKLGREHILQEMSLALASARSSLSENAPRIHSMQINPKKIGEVIGSGGKTVREITEKTGAKIEIEDSGLVKIISADQAASESAEQMIQDIISDPEEGKIYENTKVVKLLDFGFVAEFVGKNQGLVHISEIADKHIDKVEQEVSIGDIVKVKLVKIEGYGKYRLSMKSVDQETGEDISHLFEKKKRGA